jgi:hypothetical protein
MRNNERHERNDRHERVASKQEGRRSAEKRTNRSRIDKRCGARPLSCPPTAGGPRPKTSSRLHRALDLKKRSGRARLSAPHRGVRGLLGLGSAQAALPGITGCKREDPLRHQCSEHLAVRHAPDGTMPKPPASAVYGCAHENCSRSALRSTLAKGVPLRARCWFGNCIGDRCQEQCHFIRDAPLGALAQRNPPFSVLSARRSRDHEP